MARTKLTMRQIQEILRLKHQNQLSIREIARSCGLPTSTIGDYLKRAAAAGIVWPLAEGQSEKELLQLLLAQPAAEPAAVALPDWPYIHQELRRKRVTLFLLWQEYSKGQPEGYCYSRFCQLYRRWAGTLDPVLRQVHLPGEKMFVDWAGQKVEIHNAQDGSVSEGHLFVAVLGASNKTYAEAFENEQLAAWIEAHCHAYNFFQGVARITVPDNLKTGVIRPCRYEPLLHRSYQEMAEHYGTVVIPARIKKPRDKAKAEGAVLIAERQILAVLRDQRFFHVGQLNAAIVPLLAKLNEQPFQKLEGSRNSLFETLEKDHLLPLPATAFELADWSKAKVNIDYHVAVENHFYSAPYQLIHQQLDVRLTAKTIELFQAANAWRLIDAAFSQAILPPTRDTGLSPIKDIWHGLPAVSSSGSKPLGRSASKSWRKSWPTGLIPNKAFAPPWASSGWAKPWATSAWKPPAAGPCILAPVPLPVSTLFSSTIWKPVPWNKNCPCPVRFTKTSAAARTIVKPLPTIC